ncbi:MAG: hypothetical protein GX228_05205 [Firmicutes bacterium]|jgi:hypothetical protein|nr:hypothetical protein [Bacillota bacterium]NLL88320.1 hypothetical protein [Bacillota bacterium]
MGRSSNSLITAVLLFVVIGLVSESQIPFGSEITEYLRFVLTTDFDLNFVKKPIERLRQAFTDFDLAALTQGLPRVVTGW